MNYPNSYYAKTVNSQRKWAALRGELTVETCVIGGGLAGVATALDLAERGHSVALLEENLIGWGASGRSGGFVAEGFHLNAKALIERIGEDDARAVFELSQMGHRLLRERIDHYQIDCGPVVFGALSCALRNNPSVDLEDHVALMVRKFGVPLEHWSQAKVRENLQTDHYGGAIFNPDTFSLHPLNLVRGLAEAADQLGALIFESSPAVALTTKEGLHLVQSSSGDVRAKNIVFGCGGYITSVCRPLLLATVPVASFIAVTEPFLNGLGESIGVPYAISDLQYTPNYYRKLSDGRLLWGGRASGWESTDARIASVLKRDMKTIYPGLADSRIEYAWSGLMSYLLHEMPAIGQLGQGQWYATGFGGLGMSATTMAGRLIASAIAENDDRWRQFARFTLPFAGGPLVSRIAAQSSILFHAAREYLGFPAAVS